MILGPRGELIRKLIMRNVAERIFLVLPVLYHHLMLLLVLFGLDLAVLLGLIDRLGDGNARTAILLTIVHVLAQFALECQLIALLVTLDDLVHAEDEDHAVQGVVELLRLLKVHKVALLSMLDKYYDPCE